MIVGYSQGGIDAQNLAAADRDKVTTVITFGAPVIRASDSDDMVLHIQDKHDGIVNSTILHPLVASASVSSAADIISLSSGTISKINWWDPNNWRPWEGVHGDHETYLRLSRRLDSELAQTSNSGKAAEIENALVRFQGTIRS